MQINVDNDKICNEAIKFNISQGWALTRKKALRVIVKCVIYISNM